MRTAFVENTQHTSTDLCAVCVAVDYRKTLSRSLSFSVISQHN